MSYPPPHPGPSADLSLIDDLIIGYRSAHALFAAVSLGIFNTLATGPRAADALAAQLHTDPRATETLLDSLAAIGLVDKNANLYRNAPVADQFLRDDSPTSLVSNLQFQQLVAGAWAQLPQAVRTGSPPLALPTLLADHPEFVDRYILGMANISQRPARELAAQLDLGNARQVLDVGGGGGVYAQALLARSPGLRVTLLDLPNTLQVARRRLADSPDLQRIDFQEGDYHTADFGRSSFDLVLFSHVLHDEGENENKLLMKKALDALRPVGQVVVHDFMPDATRTRPLFPALFSLHMLTYTAKGRAYCADEYEAWLEGCGFREARRITVCADRPTATTAIVARKR